MVLVYPDCDPGIDDALAIGYLLAHPDVEPALVGSVSGNTDAVTAAANARDLLALFGRTRSSRTATGTVILAK